METLRNSRINVISKPEEVDMADAWYEFATVDHFWIKGRFRALQNNLHKLRSKKLSFLEIGCGSGTVIKQIEKFTDHSIDGCDLNMFALSKIDNIKGKLYCLNIFEKPEELRENYDGVIYLDVIEHIENDAIFIETGTFYTCKDGYIVINVPALNLLFSKYDIQAGHKRRYTKKMIYALFEKTGIEPISVNYWGLSLLPIALIRKFMLNFISKEKIISTGFQPPSSFLNSLFDKILAIENMLLPNPIIGTSIMAIGKIKVQESHDQTNERV